ncbi:hypothetical protein HMP09_3081 [Sphingomonas sp. HMP9]|nr:hypothetical protein HMP09_3081 [Sphingomonas sp. HMP9]
MPVDIPPVVLPAVEPPMVPPLVVPPPIVPPVPPVVCAIATPGMIRAAAAIEVRIRISLSYVIEEQALQFF